MAPEPQGGTARDAREQERLYTQVAATLQKSGVYPYPEFVRPLIELIAAETERAKRESVLHELKTLRELPEIDWIDEVDKRIAKLGATDE